ncbi:MATE family efflux transporter [Allobaculum mucilyticum]|uniref:MATE family efflux transporter n=1 Tax=Allobaculum mucilyticum TaxID=2834459 RepID=UPI001E4D341A|nr:MATE family efflux transporter [Allobaculum mucilyticum]UNT95705.1 MATE family efflux transporter [Allobaculum mucilyticum]
MTSSELLLKVREHEPLSARDQRSLILLLCWPAILAQLSVTVMQIIDASMVGHIGVHAGAAIGLVSSSTWLINGICSGCIFGFSVQASQAIGAQDFHRAQAVCRQGLIVLMIVGALIGLAGFSLAPFIPGWLGGDPSLHSDASSYLAIFCASLPLTLLNSWAVNMLQAAGDTKLPGLTQIAMCVLDVTFNYLFIFVLGLGVAGAALGTAAATACAALFLSWRLLFYNPFLKGKTKPGFTRQSLTAAVRIGLPISFAQLISGSSYVMYTRIVSPLGPVSIAANSFAVTAESLCYMPGYGCGSAATAIIGQCTGAGRPELTREIGWRITRIGIAMMSVSGVVLFIAAPWMMKILTPDAEVIALGSFILRMEAFAEPMYGASIVADGVLRGAGDTFWPACLNFLSIWCIRIPLCAILCQHFGLVGGWMGMGIELNMRGIFFLLRLRHTLNRTKQTQPAL